MERNTFEFTVIIALHSFTPVYQAHDREPLVCSFSKVRSEREVSCTKYTDLSHSAYFVLWLLFLLSLMVIAHIYLMWDHSGHELPRKRIMTFCFLYALKNVLCVRLCARGWDKQEGRQQNPSLQESYRKVEKLR